MYRMTFVVGIERFNGAVWDEIRAALRGSGVDCHIERFHEGHIDGADPALARALRTTDIVFLSLINMRAQAEWLQGQLEHTRGHGLNPSCRASLQGSQGRASQGHSSPHAIGDPWAR